MQIDLKNAIRAALAGSSSQQPVDVRDLYRVGARRALPEEMVQRVLVEMYRDREVYCCLHTRRGKETSVWWSVGKTSRPHSYGRTGRTCGS